MVKMMVSGWVGEKKSHSRETGETIHILVKRWEVGVAHWQDYL